MRLPAAALLAATLAAPPARAAGAAPALPGIVVPAGPAVPGLGRRARGT